jgi:glycosyltransferase involved in cell wall biosynthesis
MPKHRARDGTGPVGYVLRKFPVLSETFILNELLELEARGVSLHLMSLMRPNDPRFHEDLPKLKARISYLPDGLGKLLVYQRRLARADRRRYARTLLFVLRSGRPRTLRLLLEAGFVANETRRLGLRHLHAHFANEPATVAQLASMLTGVPFSFTAHATDIFKYRTNVKALSCKIESARFVVTVSDFNKGYLRRIAPGADGKIVRVYNGIPLDRFAPNGRPPPRPFRIVCVARLVEKKGLPILIEACRILRDRGLRFRCDIVGKGILRSQLESLIKRWKLKKHVFLLGPHSQLEVLERYQSAHLYVLPCIVGSDGNREGLPVSIVEALACGLPVVATPLTGIPEAVRDGFNGLIVPPGDPRSLAGAIERLIHDRELYERLRANARRSVAPQFDRRRTAAQLHALLEGSVP